MVPCFRHHYFMIQMFRNFVKFCATKHLSDLTSEVDFDNVSLVSAFSFALRTQTLLDQKYGVFFS